MRSIRYVLLFRFPMRICDSTVSAAIWPVACLYPRRMKTAAVAMINPEALRIHKHA